VQVFSSESVERPLAIFVCHTIFNFGPDHHLDTVHEVVHDVVQGGLQGLRIYQVEIDFLVCTNLDPNVALDEVEEPTDGQSFIDLPFFLAFFVNLDLEEGDTAGGTSDQSPILEQVH
jgi:hypothetical protein